MIKIIQKIDKKYRKNDKKKGQKYKKMQRIGSGKPVSNGRRASKLDLKWLCMSS